MSPDTRRTAARLAAPLVFLLAATIAVLLVRAGLEPDEPQRPPQPSLSSPATVVVRRGDTLTSIAEAAGTTVDELRRLNPGIDPVQLEPGRRIRVR